MIIFKRFSTKNVMANNVCQEYIQNKHHLLTEFIKYLGCTCIAHVDETDKGRCIARKGASLKVRAKMNDEQCKHLLMVKQIERAKREAHNKGEACPRRAQLKVKKRSRGKACNAREARRR